MLRLLTGLGLFCVLVVVGCSDSDGAADGPSAQRASTTSSATAPQTGSGPSTTVAVPPDTAASPTASVASSTVAPSTTLESVDAVLVGASGGDSTLFPDAGNGGYQVEVWFWDLVVSDDLTELEGSVVASAVAGQDLLRFSVDARGLDVSSVRVDGRVADFALIGPELVITGDEVIEFGDSFEVEIAYRAAPDLFSPAGVPFVMGWDVDPGQQLLTHGFPGATATWVPANEARFDPARYVMTITVAAGFTARAGGRLDSVTTDADTRDCRPDRYWLRDRSGLTRTSPVSRERHAFAVPKFANFCAEAAIDVGEMEHALATLDYSQR